MVIVYGSEMMPKSLHRVPIKVFKVLLLIEILSEMFTKC